MKGSCSSAHSNRPHAWSAVGISAGPGCSHPVPARDGLAALLCSQKEGVDIKTQTRYCITTIMGILMHGSTNGQHGCTLTVLLPCRKQSVHPAGVQRSLLSTIHMCYGGMGQA